MLKEFREFINRGNVIDLAVAVIMGTAFTVIVNALVNDIITPLLGIFLGGINFAGLSVNVGEASIGYGNFIQAVINFLITAWVIFLMVRSINQFQRKLHWAKEEAPPAPPEPSEEAKLLAEIRDLLKERKLQ